MRFKFLVMILALFIGVLLIPRAHTTTINGSRLVEDFSTLDYADMQASTGLWNIVDRVAQSGAVANGVATRPISFGDGSDGDLDTGSGYVFDTDARPNGYNFKSVNITGGTITVQGSNPLIIRSLSTVNITPTLNLTGGTGVAGSTTVTSAPSGGVGKACKGTGGKGGTATSAGPASAGENLFIYDGTQEAATGGAAAGAGTNGGDGSTSLSTNPGPDFDTASQFICGNGGGGGGGQVQGDTTFATGGAGGAGGGALRITAVGNLTLGQVSANGGAGGIGPKDSTKCGGQGGGGSGGAIWLQTLKTLTTPGGQDPTVDGGNSGDNNAPTGGVCSSGSGQGLSGAKRGDSKAASRPAWAAAACPSNCNTDNTAANKTYTIYSKAYDLNVLNAGFDGASITKSTPGGSGSASIEYAGSSDGKNFSEFVSDITSLSGKSYRYVKFKISISTTAAAASPVVSLVSIDYKDNGLEKLEMKLSAGCGTLSNHDGRGTPLLHGSLWNGIRYMMVWFLVWLALYQITRSLMVKF